MINVGVGAQKSIRELVALVADVVGYQGGRIRALGWNPETSLREGIGLAYPDFLDRYEAA